MCSRKCWIVSFFYFFCTFPIGNFLSEGRFWTTTLPHPSPNCHQSQKLEFCSYFCPKKCPSFACTFTKMSLSEGFGTLPFQTFLWTLPSDSYWLMLPPHIKAHQFSGEIPAENFPCTLGGKSRRVLYLVFLRPLWQWGDRRTKRQTQFCPLNRPGEKQRD